MCLNQHIISCKNQVFWLITLTALVFASCSPAKYVPEGDYLISKNRLSSTQKTISEDELKSYIIQRPNKKLLGVRFYLFLYNLSNPEKVKWPHNWLRKIGEEPVIFDSTKTAYSRQQIAQFLENKGYYHAHVEDTVKFKGNNAKVFYHVDPDNPYRISRITYFFEDTGLVSYILPDTVNSLIGKGMRFDKDALQDERVRIETMLKENGFFKFSKEYIFYEATIDENNYTVDLTLNFKEFVEGTPDPRTKIKQHKQFAIGNVFVYPDYLQLNVSNPGSSGSILLDTLLYRGQYFLYADKKKLKPGVIVNSSYIIPGEQYKLSNVNKTYQNLSQLGVMRYTNISFQETDSLNYNGTENLLDCKIELSPKKVQSVQPEISGTNSAGDLGIRGNLQYQNLNLFRGAEVFNMRINGAIEALHNRSEDKYKSMTELGAEMSITFPKFLSPFRLEGFVKKYSPKTSISLSFNYQSRPDYTRSIANSAFAYHWRGSQYLTHSIWPFELNYVQIYENNSSTEFLDSITNTPLGYSFEDHLVTVMRYSLELNNQAVGKSTNFIFTRLNVEAAGNILNTGSRIFNSQVDSAGTYKLFKVPYFQYIRGDVDIRYYNIIDKQNTFVYRLFVGAGYPYGNSNALPYEKKYFSGGPNSIRAWNTRDLGPGSFIDTDTTASSVFYYPNKNGDIKLEANVEYRFKIIWKMEGAIFADMGNVWDIRKDENRPGADFSWNRFYKEIAVGTGFGTRFDFSFFILRMDFGIKLRDPNTGWIPVFKDFTFNDLHFKFGIGYPF